MSLSVVVRRFAATAAASALVAAIGSLLHAQAPAPNNPPLTPRSILVFPQRDFVSASGFAEGDVVTVEVFHPGSTVAASTAPGVIPQDDPATPGFDGIVEVNHPGGACWANVTPDIRPGDRVRTVRKDAFGAILGIDETTIANVVAKRPVQTAPDTVVIRGTAQRADGTPIDITQLEQRMVAPRDAFDVNGRRTLRASSVAGAEDGVLTYDAPGGTAWTATYSGLDAADVARALDAESRIMWLGADPGAAVEGTIYEIGAGIVPGPSAPCAAPLEKLPPPPGSELVPPSDPTNVTASVGGASSTTVSLQWSPSTDNVGVTSYGIYRNGVAIANVENPDGSAPAPVFYDDMNVPSGTYTYAVDAADAIGNRSAMVKATPASITITSQAADNLPLCSGAPTAACVSEPPAATPTQVQIIPFPARDFTSASGYTEDVASVAVQVIRNGLLISTASVIPVDDPTTVGFDGIVEVNHPGGGCWVGVTPDIRANDIVRQIAYAGDGTVMRVDQTHVSNISVERPRIVTLPSTAVSSDGVVEVHGTAMGADGAPIPLDQITQRLVAPRDRFDFNGRRTLRAGLGEDFELSYDRTNNPDGIKFTATFTGLNENDVYRAVGGTTSAGRSFAGAESRILFLGLPTAIAPEITIYENSELTISGPSAGACTAPIEPLDTAAPSTPAGLEASQATGSNTVHLTWAASTDDTYVNGYGIYRDGVRIHNVGPAVTSYDDVNVTSGSHTYAVDAVDSASPLKANFPPIANDVNASDPILQGVAYGNRSPRSADVTVSQPDVLAPSVPANLVGTATANLDANKKIVSWKVTLTWQPSTDNVGVSSYRVYRAGRTAVDVATAAYTDTVPANTTSTPVIYTYRVDAADAAANRSAQSEPVSVAISGQVDTSKPTTPGSLVADTRDLYASATAPAIGPRDVTLRWAAATDNSGVAGYGIYRRDAASLNPTAAFTKVADVNGSTLAYTDRDLAVGTYDFTVDAVDSSGNRSTAALAATNVVTVSDPPAGKHAIMSFSSRDFVSSGGYAVAEGPMVVSVIRGGKVWARSTPVAVVEDPATPGLGAAEVNHPGGGCWDTAKLNGLDGITPDLRPGDIVRFTNRFGKADQTTTANVYADRATDRAVDGSPLPAGVIQVHGSAQDALGHPLPLEQIESRIIASSAAPFDVNARRDLRAAGDGTIAYDAVNPLTNPAGTNWTATYTGLSVNDVELAKASDSRAVWLGRDPIALSELTFFENGADIAGGPAGPQCTAPAEAGPAVTFEEAGAIEASFDPGLPSMVFPPRSTGTPVSQTLVLTNVGTADAARGINGTLSIASAALEVGGDFSLTSNTCSAANVALNNTCTVTVTFSPTVPGTRTARLLFRDNVNNSPVQVMALSGDAFDAQAPAVTAPVMTLVNNTTLNVSTGSLTVNVAASATDASGIASMQLDMSTDAGHTWTALKTSATGQVATTLTFVQGPTYQFRATATDKQGNASAPVTSPVYRTAVTDDNAGTPRFSGSWSSQRNSPITVGAFASTIHEATAPSPGKTNTVTFTFTGTEVALIAAVGPDRGQVSISVDGKPAQLVDLYATRQQQATVVGAASGLGAGTHTVTVNVLGSRNAASTGTRVDVDAFVVKF
ncbi:MAG TPA: hypothetical protein VN654_27490 [Vicinamibacterales bacterium]|nr:hypothetical protein [Vicinamibacterales bacterium]